MVFGYHNLETSMFIAICYGASIILIYRYLGTIY